MTRSRPIRSAPRPLPRALPALAPLALALLGALPLGGCIGAAPPTIHVLSTSVVSDDGRVATLRIDIEATNNDDATLPLRTVRYAVDHDGATLFAAVRSPELTLPPKESRRFSLPAVVPSGEADAPLRITGRLGWVPPSVFARSLWEADFYKPGVTFEATAETRGEMPGAQANAAAPQPDALSSN